MYNMDLLHKFDDLIEDELKRVIKNGEIQPNEWENLEKVVCIMEKVKKTEKMLIEMEDYGYDNYSSNSYNTPFMPRTSYDGMRNVNDGISHTRGRSKMTGRYVSRDYGRSGHSIKDRVVDQIERMYDEATTDHERHVLDDMIRIIESSER